MGCCNSTPREITGSAPSQAHSASSSRADIQNAGRLPDHTSARYALRQGSVPPNADSIAAAVVPGDAANRPLRFPISWKSTSRSWTRAQLQDEREAFFHTRVTGNPEAWAAVRLAIENARDGRDLATAQTILDAAGLSCPTGRISEGIWDERGVLYKVPKFVCSDPVNVLSGDEDDAQEDGEGKEVLDLAAHDDAEDEEDTVGSGPMVKIRARLSDRAQDVVMHMDANAKVRMIIRRICDEAKISDATKVKLAYLGKVLKLDESLSAQGWREGHIVNALVIYVP